MSRELSINDSENFISIECAKILILPIGKKPKLHLTNQCSQLIEIQVDSTHWDLYCDRFPTPKKQLTSRQLTIYSIHQIEIP